ncbi:MAG: prepilin-type N-terminal cleavage/methylation domain-containing protein [Gemmatimonadota bacterium]
MSKPSGVTLVELLVVLLVMGLTTALVVPSLIVPEPSREPPVNALLARVVDMAAAREQPLELQVHADGHWQVFADGAREALAEGTFPDRASQPFVLLVSSLGTCGPEPGASLPFDLDPLTCAVR